MIRWGLARKFSLGVNNKIVIIGGGLGGIMTAGRLIRKGVVEPNQISIIDGSLIHYYKPGWTLYGAEQLAKELVEMPMRPQIPSGVHFIDHYVQEVRPQENTLILNNGTKVTYENLIISSGIKFDFEKVKGLKEALEDPTREVASVYHYATIQKLQKARKTKYDTAVFTQSKDPLTCAGAPQKVLYLTMEGWKKQGYKPTVKFFQAGQAIFSVPFYAQALQKILDNKGVEHYLKHQIVEVTADNKAIFDKTEDNGTISKVQVPFDFLHAVPPMSGLDYLKNSGLVDPNNFVKVNGQTLRNETFKNVWALGDGTNLATSKTMSAAIDQAIVLTSQLEHELKKTGTAKIYDGYTACPIVVGDGKVMMAEFKYGLKIAPSFHPDQRKPTWYFYQMKKRVFPFANKYLIPRGLWAGRKTFWDPSGLDYTDFQKHEEIKGSR